MDGREQRFGRLALLTALIFGFIGLAGRVPLNREPARPVMDSRVPGVRLFGEPDAAQEAVEIVFTGDVMLGRGVSGEDEALTEVSRELSQADLTVGNLEGVLVAPGALNNVELTQSAERGYRLDATARMASRLQAAGFDLLGVANNHAYDRGPDGLAETAGYLRRLGICPLGERRGQAIYRTVRGVRLAFLAFNLAPVPGMPQALWDREIDLEAVRDARGKADAVLVLVHWGEEYQTEANSAQETTAAELVQAGADLIVGSHPHVLQGTQAIRRDDGRMAFAAYSLGNFIFDQGAVETRHGVALRVQVTRGGLQKVEALPVYAYLRARWKPLGDAEFVERMIPPGKDFAYRCSPNGCDPVDPLGRAGEGRFAAGQIDLTGDGSPEWIVREGERVAFYQPGSKVWQNPAEWRVYDVSLGDPNDDGRFEAVVVFDKTDVKGRKAGQVASHPFLIGFRNGQYAEVWGGSAVADPIREVEVGDVDGDGRDDLVVLEERCWAESSREKDGSCGRLSVAVWRWNGWGFSLLWRGPEGRLRALSLCPDGNGDPLICVERGW